MISPYVIRKFTNFNKETPMHPNIINCSTFISLVGSISGALPVLTYKALKGEYPDALTVFVIAPIAAYTTPFLIDAKDYFISRIWGEEETSSSTSNTEPACDSLITSGAETGATVSLAFTTGLELGKLIFMGNSNCLMAIANIAINTIEGSVVGSLVGYAYSPSSSDNDNYLAGESFCSDDNDCYNGLF